ncbi:TonB-dependent siderophore receptor [Sphingomonas bacterium]|uniref:TonB-dependent receptor plug domain-containing protein n=1 Tax=Sphingomonas bacterium TaxID=1895847 RepID=UPI00157711D0|nr:TonB-dependent receptor [Sphingomonas bacterium]
MFSTARVSRIALGIALCSGFASVAGAQQLAVTATTPPGPAPQEGAEIPQVGDDIIVTGTRAGGITAAESAAPIKVLGAETLSHVGQPNLNQVLTQLVPSFTAQAFGGDTANLTLSARLRGLSPNHTLVLINGKRRHGTSNLAVLGGPYQGAATADLDLIPPAAIERIEVLEDGAAAQYGSDAIAGVINIILKSDAEPGGDASFTGGSNYNTGGQTFSGTAHLSTKVGAAGFFDLTAFYRFHDFTQVGGRDRRVTDSSGNLLASLSAAQRPLYANITEFPEVNRINGDAQSNLTTLSYNTGYDFGGIQAYSFGTYGRRLASAYENLRVPDRVIASPVLGVAGSLTTPGEIVFNPNGFNPREGIRENDYAFTGGAKGMLGQFHYDLSTTYGQDKNDIYTYDSANRSLFINTHSTPRNFYDGFFKASEFTANADFTRDFDLGLAKPLNLAFGGEYRKDRYQIGAGDAASTYLEGGQSYPGFRASDAGIHARENESAYVDVAVNPITPWKIDGAVRYEHYSDFGSKVIFKGTTRFDFSPAFALRGTVSTGFRAPTLAESYYSATNVSPTSATVQLPANSAAAKILGFSNLKPERSTNYSIGTVIRPVERLTLTVDAYQVTIKDRILGTGTIFSAGGGTDPVTGQPLNFPLVRTAVAANGNILDPTVTQTGISVFTNGADTRTRGVDVVLSYLTDFGNAGSVNWTISGNYNNTKLTRLSAAPPLVNVNGVTIQQPVFDKGAQSFVTTASPRVKVVASAFYTLERFSATLRETGYGTTSAQYSPDGGNFYTQRIGNAFISDVELNYKATHNIEFSIGANNFFNKKPPVFQCVVNATTQAPCSTLSGAPTIVSGGNVYDAPLGFSPYGINGGYYYGRINLHF